jgi:hypothetical protein
MALRGGLIVVCSEMSGRLVGLHADGVGLSADHCHITLRAAICKCCAAVITAGSYRQKFLNRVGLSSV